MKTREQVDELKQQWKADGCWDIETTEGFEEYHDELLKFRLDYEKSVQEGEKIRLDNKSSELGISINMVKYIERLEYQVERLSQRIEKLEEPDEATNSMQEYYLHKARK